MEKITRIFIFTSILNSIKMDTYVYDDYDVQFEIKSLLSKMKSLSIDVQRIHRKQVAMERRFRKFPTNINADGNNENILEIKKAFSTEKKHLRTLIQSWEKTIEAKGFQKIHKELSTEIKDIEEKVEQQENTTSELSLQLENFKETIDVVSNISEERHETLGKKLSNIETKSDSIEERIDLMSSNMSSSEKKVSFSVQFLPHEGYVATIFPKSTTIIFKIVHNNDGEGYNESSGVFTVPVAGVYQFIYFVQGWHLADNVTCPDASVVLYIDGIGYGIAVADPRHERQVATGGNSCIKYLNKGQRVQIGTSSMCEKYVIFGHRTSFSGHLLY